MDVAGVAPLADDVPEDGREVTGVAPWANDARENGLGAVGVAPAESDGDVGDGDAQENGLEAVGVVPPEDGEGAAGDDTGPSAPLTPTAPHCPAGLRSCLAAGKATQAWRRLAQRAAQGPDRVAAGQAAQEQGPLSAMPSGPGNRGRWP